jgi:hypothetical protein
MPLSITITHPMPGAVVGADFKVCGTFQDTCTTALPTKDQGIDRNFELYLARTIKVTVSNGTNSYTRNATIHGTNCWEAIFTNVAIGNDYVVTAKITNNCDEEFEHSIETIDVVALPIIIIPVVCCLTIPTPPPPPPPPPDQHQVLPLGTTAKVTIKGTISKPGTEVLVIPQRLVSTVTRPRAGVTHLRSRAGSFRAGKAVPPKSRTEWEATHDIPAEHFFRVFLKDGNDIVAATSSALY